MSAVDSTNEHSLEAFRAAFEKVKESVAVQFAKSFREHVPSSLLPEAKIDTASRATVDQYLAALVAPDAQWFRETNADWVGQIFAQLLVRGLSAAKIHALSAAMRKVLLEVGLELRRAGVPGATDGIRRLIAASRVPVQMFDEAFRKRIAEKQRHAMVFEALFQNSPYSVGIANPDGTVRFANPSFEKLLGISDIVGRRLGSLHEPEDERRIREEVRPSIQDKGEWHGELKYCRADGGVVETRVTAFGWQNAEGQPLVRCVIIRDVGPARRAEEERRRLAEEVILAQKKALEELETPLVPIAEGVLAMPLVGKIDAMRAERMLEILLQGINMQQASVVLLDLTGVRMADEESANAIFRATEAARLLGVEVVVTGVGPEVARMFVEVNANFAGLEIKGTLGDGVRWALARMKRKS